MAKKSNQKIKLLYLMKILLENTDDEHGMTLAEISDALGEYGIDAERKRRSTTTLKCSVCSGSTSKRGRARA